MVKKYQIAVNELKDKNLSLVVVKEKQIVYKSREKSLLSLVNLLERRPKLLQNSIIADKIVGKAVAMICIYASVEYCYGSIMSEGAIDAFKKNNLPYRAGNKVKVIKDRNNSDVCPIEKLILDVNDFEKGVSKIINYVNNI